MWIMLAVGISIGICIGVVCMATETIVEEYLTIRREGKK